MALLAVTLYYIIIAMIIARAQVIILNTDAPWRPFHDLVAPRQRPCSTTGAWEGRQRNTNGAHRYRYLCPIVIFNIFCRINSTLNNHYSVSTSFPVTHRISYLPIGFLRLKQHFIIIKEQEYQHLKFNITFGITHWLLPHTEVTWTG